ncbi:DUF2760 domain-containing protein [Planctomicrobium sp. SH527]|uniref:DUF2760 domain-containing protein n=1 Tax=Planctomicrobium sp. SH527 TaxID=3448123 RepID=UPI003F5BA02B
MGRIGLAFRVFFNVLFNAQKADRVRALELAEPEVDATAPAAPVEKPVVATPVAKSAPLPEAEPARSEALTLLETLQREARFLDFIQEDISAYTDQQVGGAVRDVHRGCHAALQRLFDLKPATDVAEGQKLTVDGNQSAARVRLVGRVVESRPVTGVVVHPGWQAGRCELPTWNGASENRLLLAPVEVELS